MATPVKVCSWCPHAERSKELHNFLFAVIAVAFHNWPPQHKFKPVDAENLRGWLLCRVGWCVRVPVNLIEHTSNVKLAVQIATATAKAAKSALLPRDYYAEMIQTDTGIDIVGPKSLKKEFCTGSEFNEIAEKVLNEISFHLGIPVEMLKQEGKRHQQERRQKSKVGKKNDNTEARDTVHN